MASIDTGARLKAPATARNREPILHVLAPRLPSEGGLLLELASGTGEHAVHLAPRLPGWVWQPSDPDPRSRASIEAWRQHLGVDDRVRPPLAIDARDAAWPVSQADAMVAINMIHISPIEATQGLFEGAARVLDPGAPLFTYGPYRVGGAHTAPSNEAFDAHLRARDESWGVRDVEELAVMARGCGLELRERVAMPANNFVLVFHRLAE